LCAAAAPPFWGAAAVGTAVLRSRSRRSSPWLYRWFLPLLVSPSIMCDGGSVLLFERLCFEEVAEFVVLIGCIALLAGLLAGRCRGGCIRMSCGLMRIHSARSRVCTQVLILCGGGSVSLLRVCALRS
jgi:hypothetical protein